MDEYTRFKQDLDKKYREPDGIEQRDGVISLYDLIDILEMGFDDLKLTMDGSALRNQINQDRTVLQRINLFKKKRVIDKKCTSIISSFNKDKCRISFGFEDSSRSMGSRFVVLIKDKGSDELYFESDYFADKEFATKYVSEIYGMFAVLEEYATYFPQNEKGETSSITQTFDDGTLAVEVSVYRNGTVHYTITPSKDYDPSKVFNREWLSRVKLSAYVEDNDIDILDNIPVEISSLNDAFRAMVEADLEKEKSASLTKNIGGMAN